jgi:uncharacterized protein DUF3302
VLSIDIRTCAAARVRAAATLLWAALLPASASASILSGEALDTAANVMSWVVLVIVLFWIVHVLPEKIAHKRHHPQRDAIQTLCLLSLAFGGLLWPLAWLWAYTKPVAYKVAYGTERHEDYYTEHVEQVEAADISTERLIQLRDELDVMQSRGGLSPTLQRLRDRVAARIAERSVDATGSA